MLEGSAYCSWENEVYVYGGILLNAPAASNALSKFTLIPDGDVQSCVISSACPTRTVFGSLLPTKDALYLFHGSNEETGYVADTYRFHFETLTWEKIECAGVIPSPRDKHCVTVGSGKFYVFGGFGPREDSEMSVSLTKEGNTAPQTSAEAQQMAKNEGEPECEEDDTDGDDDSEDDEGSECAITLGWFNDLYTFDPTILTWSPCRVKKGEVPAPRAAATINFLPDPRGGKLIVFGGKTAAGRQNDVNIYSIDMSMWFTKCKVKGTNPCGRSFHSSCMLPPSRATGDQNGHLLICGGRDNENVTLNDVFLLNLTVWEWTQVQLPMAESRCCHAVVYRHDKLFVLGGVANFQEELMLCTEGRGNETLTCSELCSPTSKETSTNSKLTVDHCNNEENNAIAGQEKRPRLMETAGSESAAMADDSRNGTKI